MSEEKEAIWWEKKGWTISKCCQYPISSPDWRFDSGRIRWRCSKCNRITDKHGLVIDDDPPDFSQKQSHGLERKDKMAGNAYQAEN